MSSLKILAAEDNADDVFILREAFRKAGVGYRVEDVGDGAAVLAYLNGEMAIPIGTCTLFQRSCYWI